MVRMIRRRHRRVRRALDSARILDHVVNNQLPLLSRLSEERRRRAAEFLAELVLLAQAYRHYAAGWISHRELQRRGVTIMDRVAAIRRRPDRSAAQFTERD